MSLASEKLKTIRDQVQYHLDRAEQKQLTPEQEQSLKNQIKARLQEENAVIVAHYYTSPAIQALAEESGGCVSDSLEMARFGHDHPASTLVVAGVKFMGETAKILTPQKRVLMPTLEATCSLDLGCPIDEFSAFCDQHPERKVVVYANTSAAVKARADWVVTSSIALDVVEHLTEQGEKILWAPDQYLGDAHVGWRVHCTRGIQSTRYRRFEASLSRCRGTGASRITRCSGGLSRSSGFNHTDYSGCK